MPQETHTAVFLRNSVSEKKVTKKLIWFQANFVHIQWISTPKNMGVSVSRNRGTPKSSILIRCSIIFTIHFGGNTPYFWKHPYLPQSTQQQPFHPPTTPRPPFLVQVTYLGKNHHCRGKSFSTTSRKKKRQRKGWNLGYFSWLCLYWSLFWAFVLGMELFPKKTLSSKNGEICSICKKTCPKDGRHFPFFQRPPEEGEILTEGSLLPSFQDLWCWKSAKTFCNWKRPLAIGQFCFIHLLKISDGQINSSSQHVWKIKLKKHNNTGSVWRIL